MLMNQFFNRIHYSVSPPRHGASTMAYITALETEIDAMMYHLYGLSYAEVLLVEPGFGMSETEYVAVGATILANNSATA